MMLVDADGSSFSTSAERWNRLHVEGEPLSELIKAAHFHACFSVPVLEHYPT
jgi:hypothetical protein